MLWIILLCVPLPYIANTAGWLTAEVGRQPWLVYGLLRTDQGYSTNVMAGNSMSTLLGYMGLYLVLGVLFLFLIQQEIGHGPAIAAGGDVRHESVGIGTAVFRSQHAHLEVWRH
jgi:cytochrome d ubiquinol oxidase subunit I